MYLEQAKLFLCMMLGWCPVCGLLAGGCDRKDDVGKDNALSSVPALSTRTGVIQPSDEQKVPSQDVGTMGSVAADTQATTSTALERPAESTQATTTASAVPGFRPLLDAVESEWALLSAMGSRQIRYEVVRTGAATITIEVTVFDQNKPLGLPAMREELRDFDPLDEQARTVKAIRSSSQTTTEAAGRVWDAVIYEDMWTDEEIVYVRRTWVSSQAPVLGTLRMELYGNNALEASLELMAFGP